MAARKKKAAKRATKKRATTTKKKTTSAAASKKAPARRKKAGAKKTTTARKKTASRKPAAASEAPFGEVEALVELMDKHGLLELDYKSGPDGTREVRLSRAGTAAAPAFAPAVAAPAPAAPAAAAAPSDSASAPASTEGLVPFTSPMVGSFYRASSPEAAPFVSVGDKVDANSVVCIIEAMKVMNEITPDVHGEIASIEVENGEAVEFGQTLFLVRPT